MSVGRILELERSFGELYSAKENHLKLRLLLTGKAYAILELEGNKEILTMHNFPMVRGKRIEDFAVMVGIYAAMTLTTPEEYVLYIKTEKGKLYAPTIQAERGLRINARVINDRLAKPDLISVAVEVKNLNNVSRPHTLKAQYIFHYAVRPAVLWEEKLKQIEKKELSAF
ncbi:hypothetical protein A2W54_03445 [Candidatus Giovannonibacteria bacterium RIFCSPHIGHO2_02_43_13]|uniref:Uncharacterized protein n=1 Tax=Candidatus Giovannonibacteria bacterium RIFCSPHIGHO2_02_43_13 TaxID=1798330 RepID=A0A1F5WRF8_9BACT|nr:MAG: hypothetical protein A2W54_03445 [Candidatus Giovannonibacteria bacterium RIFCSPHIGHO2_02_43_13]OGF96798.1 MAG: hypothetical protein A3H08_01300 [Candidatus Giovannonibacteria bacterium RIFCSPLOWO2_12_FULL_44_32]